MKSIYLGPKRQRQLGKAGLHSLLGYYASLNTATPTNAPAITINETNFVAQGSVPNWIFTEPYDLAAMTAIGATLAQAQIFDATYQAVNIPQLYPVIFGGIVPPSNPNVVDLRNQPWPIPMNEQFGMQLANAAGGAEDDYGLIWIVPSGSAPWLTAPPTPTLGAPRVYAQISASIVLTEHVWSPFVTIAFTSTLKGGAYRVNGCYWVIPHALAFRHSFPKMPLYNGRKLTPGGLVENAYGNVPLKQGAGWMGVHGAFNYFEPFQVSALGTTTEGATTYYGIADMSYMGDTYGNGGVPSV